MVKTAKLISRKECLIILEKHFQDENFELLDYLVRPLSEGVEGFLGEHYIIDAYVLRQNEKVAVSFFAKIPPLQHDLMMEFVRTGNAFEKEEFFYEVLIRDFKNYCPSFDENILPKFYLSRNNDIVVMENLQEKSFQVAPFTDTMDSSHIKVILKTLSKLHSASIIYEEKKSEELGRPFRLIDHYAEMLSEGFFQDDENFLGHKWHVASRKGILNTLHLMDNIPEPKEDFQKKFHDLTERCIEIVKPSPRFRNVVSHGDLWLKNVLFRYENGIPSECKLVDWQLMKYNPPAFDVLKIIYQSTTSKQRQKHFDDFMKYYYDSLCKELILGDLDPNVVLSRDEFLASVKYMLPECKVETCYYYTFQKFGPEFLKKLMSNPEDFKTFTFGDRTQWMLEYYKPCSVYKKWVDEMMNEIRDMLLNHNVTREDCYAILRAKLNSTEYTLINYTTKAIEEKTGFMADYIKLQIEVQELNEVEVHNFFMKEVPSKAHSTFAIESGAFANEILAYDQILSKMKLFNLNMVYDCVPKYYYSRKDDLIVLEDLNTSGFHMADKRKHFNLEEMALLLKKLAKFHSCSLLLEEKLSETNGRKFRLENQYKKHIKETFFVKKEGHLGFEMTKSILKGIHKMIEIFPDQNSIISNEKLKKVLDGFMDKDIYDQVESSLKYRNVLCHGDLWANNILLKYDANKPVDCRFVDLQSIRICPPAHDVMSLIYLTTTRALRSEHLSDILNLYYTELSAILNQHGRHLDGLIPYSEFLQSCQEYKVFAVNFAVQSFPFIMITAEEMSKIINDPVLSRKLWFDDCSEFICDMVKKDEQFKVILEESIMDLRELCRDYCNKFIIDHIIDCQEK